MRRFDRSSTLAACALLVLAGTAESQDAATSSIVVAFENVTVLPMDGERALPAHTVVVEGDRIVEIGPSETTLPPANATRIDGTGRYLVPGLAEMHAHVPTAADPMRELVEEILFLYLANGITTIRGMLGAPYQLELRDEIARGEVLGPTLYVGAPSLNGSSAPDPESAEALVRAHARDGYDFLKIHPGVPLDAWDRMVEVAREVGITYAGHVPAAVGIEHAIRTGMSTVDHLDGYLEVTRLQGLAESTPAEERYRATDRNRLAELARRTAEAGVFVVPTQYLWNHLFGWNHMFGWVNADSVIALPEFRYVSPAQREAWITNVWNRMASPDVTPESARAHAEWRRELLEALHRAGVPMLLGTDSPQLFNVPGFSLHREVVLMVEAGMTPYQVLESGTWNVARYVEEELGLPGDFGRIAPGFRADLILLDDNPLDGLEALQALAGVMVRGRWLPEAEIRDRLDGIARRYVEEQTD